MSSRMSDNADADTGGQSCERCGRPTGPTYGANLCSLCLIAPSLPEHLAHLIPRQLYYDRAGRPVSQEQWSDLYRQERHIGLDRIGEVEVSTVWMGLDHAILGGPPLIFETMIFGGPDDREMERYSTEVAARAGHDRWVARQRHLLA